MLPDFQFIKQDMEALIWEALIIAATVVGGARYAEINNQLRPIADQLLIKVRNYAMTGDPNGGR